VGRLLPPAWTGRGALIPVLRFSGAIGLSTPLRPGLTLSTSAAAIEKPSPCAAPRRSPSRSTPRRLGRAVGADLQAHQSARRGEGLKVYVFAEDVAASGGYLLALAGDEIYADASSIVGSIGVVTATFG
jgi:hypothetical protein